MITLAIIGGTALTRLEGLMVVERRNIKTPYGDPSAPLIYGTFHGRDVVFLARHGESHILPPHNINYRANIWALHQAGAHAILASSAVGGIHRDLSDGRLVIPDQIIDYTWGRAHTFFDGRENVKHVDFTEPYCRKLRELMLGAAREGNIEIWDGGTYGAAQGPRLETKAEIDKMERDGCDMVGMTGMPEAALARELSMCYGACAIVANPAAGRENGELRMEDMLVALESRMEKFRLLLRHVLLLL
uniref:Probable S-methyl-5'-thioinosine phosphorylase n=1 Tax=Candidatus Kentrum sp. TC TaxID=2126339 RepID=A0A450YZZ1_9GAMM|nr:MAG: 5'-methylthioadenosine phosphorylase/5'-methylthioinosine phosphorylase [Candidatus Kentron sp. TC]VFK47106.1 MAG: methylthioadenosine phosphorylase [Candidatus Kentron sp. TC]